MSSKEELLKYYSQLSREKIIELIQDGENSFTPEAWQFLMKRARELDISEEEIKSYSKKDIPKASSFRKGITFFLVLLAGGFGAAVGKTYGLWGILIMGIGILCFKIIYDLLKKRKNVEPIDIPRKNR